MIKVDLYINKSENNKIGKSLTKVETINCKLMDNCSIKTPIITFGGVNISSLLKSNYVGIPDLGRFYFVTDIVQINNGLWQVSLNCDVLESFKNSILNQNAIIERQENEYNLYLNDSSFKVYQKDRIQTKKFNNSFSKNGSYILMVA